MAGNNLLVAAAITPQVIVSQQLGTTEAAVYTVPASTSVKVTHGVIANVSAALTTTLTLGATSAAGGTLAAATYFWVVTAVSPAGESLVSNEVTATTSGTTSSQPLSWTAVAGATSYNVWRGTATGAENLKYSTTATTFTDTGASGTAAALPTVSTFGQAITVSLGIAKAGQTFNDKSHRVLSGYSLAVNTSLPLTGYVTGAMLGPGDMLGGFASIAGSVDFVVSGTVHS